MICIFCGKKIGKEFPIPVARLELTPVVARPEPLFGPDIHLAPTIYTDRICCQECYMKIQKNDFEAIQEAGKMPDAH